MLKFINDYQVFLFALVKILIMLGFCVNMAPILVFAERRQSALIQDRLGPNRAMISVPGVLLKVALGIPMLGAAAGVAGLFLAVFPPTAPIGVTRGFWLGELGIAVIWSHLLILLGTLRMRDVEPANALESALTSMKDPRQIFFVGLFAHAGLLAMYATFGTKPVGPALAVAFGGPAILSLALAIVGAYAAVRIPGGIVKLRLAGLFHSIADALKAAFKEDFIPERGDKLLHALAPLVALFPALVTFAIIPFGDSLCFGSLGSGKDRILDVTNMVDSIPRGAVCTENVVSLQIADLNVGILYLFAVAGTGIVGAAIAGWSSDNKWSLLGGLRAASQMVSYEVSMGLTLVGAFMIYGTPRLNEMVRWQAENSWGIFVQPLAFFLFFAAAIAEHKRVPFDAPEGESEIVAGFIVEYSSFKWLMFYTGEYIEIVTSSALLVTIFLGGWSLPFLHSDGVSIELGKSVFTSIPLSHLTVSLLQVAAYFGKVTILAFGQIFIRWTLPRFRYDQIMAFGWKFLLPSAIGNLVVTGLVMLVIQSGGESVAAAMKVASDATSFVVVGAATFVLVRFLQVMLAPVERERFFASTVAARTARMGGIKTSAMQA